MIPAELDILYQDKEFVAGRMSGNERSACLYMRWQTAESRCSCTSAQHSIRTSNHLALTSRFSSSCIHLAFLSCCCRAHFPTCALQQIPLLGTKVSIHWNLKSFHQNFRQQAGIPQNSLVPVKDAARVSESVKGFTC